MANTLGKKAEIKTRTTSKVKSDAAAVYAHWGITLNDAINMFLVKSVEVGGLPFDLRPQRPTFEDLESISYRAPLTEDNVPILPSDWLDNED